MIKRRKTHLLKVKNNGKWCTFFLKDLKIGIEFKETGKIWYLGDACRNSNIDISFWDNYGFIDVITEIIKMKLSVIWKLDESGYNWFPYRIKGKKSLIFDFLTKLEEMKT